MDRHPSDFQKRTLWLAATGVALFVIGALIVTIVVVLGKVLGLLQAVLVPLAVAGIIAYLLDPIVRWFQRRGMSRLRAVLMVFASSLVAFALLLAIIIPQIGNQMQEFHRSYERRATTAAAARPDSDPPVEKLSFAEMCIDRMVQLRNRYLWLRPSIDYLLAPPDDSRATADSNARPEIENTRLWRYSIDKADDAAQMAFGLVKGGANRLLGALGLFIGFVMVPIYLYFFLKEASGIKEHWHEYVPLRASHFKDEVVDVINEINGYLLSFFRGQMLVAFIDGLLVGIALSAFRLPLGLVIGLMLAILGVIPYIGNIICLVPACVLAYIHFGDPAYQYGWLGSNPWSYVAATAFIFFAVQQINSLVTTPKIVGDSVGLHPMTVIFSMLFWSLLLGGFIGALLAVPLTASVKVLFRRYIWEPQMADPPADKKILPNPS